MGIRNSKEKINSNKCIPNVLKFDPWAFAARLPLAAFSFSGIH
jgi:hypothetical protein